jgi:hypothetical protein
MAQPEIVFRHGCCSASIFNNEYKRGDETFSVRNVNFQRAYRDNKGAWQHTNSLKVNDLPKAVLVLNKAYEYMTSNGQAEAETEEEG